MVEKNIQKNLKSGSQKDFKKAKLEILTEENDHLLKSLKRAGGSYRGSWIDNLKILITNKIRLI